MIYLVSGDNGSQIEVALYRPDGSPRDLVGWIVKLRVRRAGTADPIYTLTGASTPEQAEAGEVVFTFSADNLTQAGLFEGEIFMTQGALISTDFPLINLKIREDF